MRVTRDAAAFSERSPLHESSEVSQLFPRRFLQLFVQFIMPPIISLRPVLRFAGFASDFVPAREITVSKIVRAFNVGSPEFPGNRRQKL